jgi:hypothetical protein
MSYNQEATSIHVHEILCRLNAVVKPAAHTTNAMHSLKIPGWGLVDVLNLRMGKDGKADALILPVQHEAPFWVALEDGHQNTTANVQKYD